MAHELAKYEERTIKRDDHKVIEKYSGGELVESHREFYMVYTMDKGGYRINDEQYGKLKILLESPVKFVEIKNDLVAVHQITKVEKRIERTFGRD